MFPSSWPLRAFPHFSTASHTGRGLLMQAPAPPLGPRHSTLEGNNIPHHHGNPSLLPHLSGQPEIICTYTRHFNSTYTHCHRQITFVLYSIDDTDSVIYTLSLFHLRHCIFNYGHCSLFQNAGIGIVTNVKGAAFMSCQKHSSFRLFYK